MWKLYRFFFCGWVTAIYHRLFYESSLACTFVQLVVVCGTLYPLFMENGKRFLNCYTKFSYTKAVFYIVLFSQPCRAGKCVMASSGFQADVRALQKHLAARHLVRFHKH